MDIAILPTHRLLALKRKHYPSKQYPRTIGDHVYDCNCRECSEVKENIENYNKTYTFIKNELARREHVNNKQGNRK